MIQPLLRFLDSTLPDEPFTIFLCTNQLQPCEHKLGSLGKLWEVQPAMHECCCQNCFPEPPQGSLGESALSSSGTERVKLGHIQSFQGSKYRFAGGSSKHWHSYTYSHIYFKFTDLQKYCKLIRNLCYSTLHLNAFRICVDFSFNHVFFSVSEANMCIFKCSN